MQLVLEYFVPFLFGIFFRFLGDSHGICSILALGSLTRFTAGLRVIWAWVSVCFEVGFGFIQGHFRVLLRLVQGLLNAGLRFIQGILGLVWVFILGICNMLERGSLMVLATCWFTIGLRFIQGWFRVCIWFIWSWFGVYLGLVYGLLKFGLRR